MAIPAIKFVEIKVRTLPLLWKANAIVFISSFCVMVIELIAGRILAPYIGVSLYSWTSIIGIILAGITLGNYFGGKVADRYPFPLLLVCIFLAGALATIAILPVTQEVMSADWFDSLPIMWNFTLRTVVIFFLPAFIMSMVSPTVIKLTLSDQGLMHTGSIVGTIYAYSTAGAILGTFMTGFYLIIWFGTRMIVWLVAATLIVAGITVYLSWRPLVPSRRFLPHLITWIAVFAEVVLALALYQAKEVWQVSYTGESNYYTIKVVKADGGVKVLYLDNFDQSYINPNEPTNLIYSYLKVFREVVKFAVRDNPKPRLLHLGGGAYCFPRYMELVYPGSVNEVVEIDPMVTQVVHEYLDLSYATTIKTYNQDARRFLIQRASGFKYDIIIGDVFNDQTTPYHLTTREFNRMVKDSLKLDGLYLVNITDNYDKYGRYLASFVNTLRQTFRYVYLFSTKNWWKGNSDFVIVGTDRYIDMSDYKRFVSLNGTREPDGTLEDPAVLDSYVAAKKPLLLTDDYAPTDILVAPLFKHE